jgi:hypothetical protein
MTPKDDAARVPSGEAPRVPSGRVPRVASTKQELSTEEAAAELGMSVAEVEHLIRRKQLPAQRGSKGWKIPRPGVESLRQPPRPGE